MSLTDLTAWWPIIAAVAVGAFALVRWAADVFSKSGQSAEERQKAREDTTTKNTDQVFTRTEALLDQQAAAIKAQREEIIEVKKQCVADLADLRARADEVERRLLERIGTLERQVADLQQQLERAIRRGNEPESKV